MSPSLYWVRDCSIRCSIRVICRKGRTTGLGNALACAFGEVGFTIRRVMDGIGNIRLRGDSQFFQVFLSYCGIVVLGTGYYNETIFGTGYCVAIGRVEDTYLTSFVLVTCLERHGKGNMRYGLDQGLGGHPILGDLFTQLRCF